MLYRSIIAAGFSLLVAGQLGCSAPADNHPQTEGERILEEAKLKQQQGLAMREGEKMVVAGEGKRAEGLALQQQGKTVDGATKIRDGEQMIQEGRMKIEQARQMRTSLEPGYAR